MSDVRLGRQTPTNSVVLPYSASKGAEAVEVYNRSGRTAQPWQELMMEDIMAVNDEGLWLHMKFGWSIPRRNGKSELLIMRSIHGVSHNERVLYTAHRTTTSHNAWEKVIDLLSKAGYREGEDFKTTKQYGMEHIEWLGGEGVINFRTRSSKGGLGEGYDLLIIDEAQEYTADQESALKYVVTDSKNPQTLMCGTPPTAVSSGDVFLKYRRRCLTGKEEDAGWAEWSVPNLTDAHAPELWYQTNPSLGTILTERTIRSELGDDQVDDNIQRLGLWLRYSQKSAISKQKWSEYALKEKPMLQKKPRVFFAVKYGHSGNVSLAAAVKLDDGRIFIEAIDCRSVRNPLWTVSGQSTTDIRYSIRAIRKQLELCRFHPCEAEIFGDPSISLFDWITYTGHTAGDGITSPVTSYVWRYHGTQTLTSCGRDAVAGVVKSQAEKAASASRMQMQGTVDNVMRSVYLKLMQQSHGAMGTFTHAVLSHYTHAELGGGNES